MITCSRKIHFCTGHRVLGHEGGCKYPHGHNYVAWIEAVAPDLDSIGRVIDFSVLKQRVGGWILENWDHAFICYEKDEDIINSFDKIKDHRLLVHTFNPTAENMADFLLHEVCPEVLDRTDVEVVKVTLYETENCYAVATI